ncbi:MAG: helix-turn-helix transcriptional regulator [Clostridia bacterium]|nr:helix-turn-helix transcriptional regulator [Clostridia bacterium]
MYYNLGEKLKSLRKERDITQEQLAECLGISSQAVSKWETNASYPDISMLPALANFYEVTTDELLGVDITKTEEKIDKIINQAERCSVKEKIGIYRQGLAEYPSSYELMYCLALALNYDGEPETYEARWKERVRLLETVRAGVRDPYLKNEADGFAFMAYKEKGMLDEAKRIAESVPAQMFTHKSLMRSLADGMEKVYEYHHDIQDDFASLCDEILSFASLMADGKSVFGPEEAIGIYDKIPELYRIFYENGDYLEANQTLSITYTRMAERYADLGDPEGVLRCIGLAIKHAKATDDYFSGLIPGVFGNTEVFGDPLLPADKRHTSVLSRPDLDYPTSTCFFGDNGLGEPESNVYLVRKASEHERFDSIRDRVNELFENG